MIEMYLNGEPLGFLPSTHFEQALSYAHTLCKLEGKGALSNQRPGICDRPSAREMLTQSASRGLGWGFRGFTLGSFAKHRGLIR